MVIATIDLLIEALLHGCESFASLMGLLVRPPLRGLIIFNRRGRERVGHSGQSPELASEIDPIKNKETVADTHPLSIYS